MKRLVIFEFCYIEYLFRVDRFILIVYAHTEILAFLDYINLLI